MAEIGVINEIGDLGLGFNPLSEKDQQVVKESQNPNKDKKETKNNK